MNEEMIVPEVVPAEGLAIVEEAPVAEAPAPEAVPAEEPEAVEMPAGEPVEESEDAPVEATAEEEPVPVQEMSLPEIVNAFERLMENRVRMKMSKEAEALKSAFYRKLTALQEPCPEMEEAFKTCYETYRKERAEYNRQQDEEKARNLELKTAIIGDLKALLEKQEDVNTTFPAFRAIQDRWKAVGPVPIQNFRNINETYHLYVEQFYDMVKINSELRDLDFRKNLEVKEEMCAEAENLAAQEDVVSAFRDLQKLHERWKEYGPVDKEHREQIWDRFKAATYEINRKYQAHFEGLKQQFEQNLAAKRELCEKMEAIVAGEIGDSAAWTACTKAVEELQKEWRTIGFASRKDNQKIYERFRAACDRFFLRKREYYSAFKDSMNANLEKKIAICEAAEALKSSTEWKKTADELVRLQKEWKEIGAVPRKKSDELWKRFRAACDEFFAERDRNQKPEDNIYANLKAKKQLVREISEYELKGDSSDAEALAAFTQRWQSIGFVPFRAKDEIAAAYRDAVRAKFGDVRERRGERRSQARPAKSPRETLMQKYHNLEQEISTYENNIGFFSMSKNSAPLIEQMKARIEEAKAQLKALADQIRSMENDKEE